MNLFVGLGNVGNEYFNTRHNIGFLFLDYLVNELGLKSDFKENSKLNTYIIKDSKNIFIKPTTFMNESGAAVQKVKNYYSVKLENIFIIHDDIDQQFGSFKFVNKGGSGGHRGIESIKKHLGTDSFSRIKIGVAPKIYDPSKHKAEDFVLKPFSSEEVSKLPDLFSEITKNYLEQLF